MLFSALLLLSTGTEAALIFQQGGLTSARKTLSSLGEASKADPFKLTNKIYEKRATGSDPDSKDKEKANPLSDPDKTIDKVREAIPNPVDALPEKVKEKIPVIPDPIDIMRGELCMARHNVVGHSKCMDWMVGRCISGSFGTGLCDRVRAVVTEECKKKDEKACDYAKQLGIEIDSDKDGVPDKDDAFPNNPKESKDTDGDGVGDNQDDYPNDPECVKKPCKEPPAAAPVPAPAAASPAPAAAKEAPAAAAVEKEAPAAAPVEKEEAKKEEPKKEEAKKEEAPAPAPKAEEEKPAAPAAATEYEDPNPKEGLQSQGFSGKKVTHADGKTATGDWRQEYGNERHAPPKKSGAESQRISAWMSLAAASLALACAA